MDQPASQTDPSVPAESTAPNARRHPVRGALTLLLAPVWVPWVLVRGLTRICGEGLLFSIETLRRQPVDLELGAARAVFDLFALVAP